MVSNIIKEEENDTNGIFRVKNQKQTDNAIDKNDKQ